MTAKNLKKNQERFEELERLLQDEANIQDGEKIKEITKEYNNLREIIAVSKELEKINQEIKEVEKIIAENEDDQELKKISEEEKSRLEKKKSDFEKKLKTLLTPPDPNDKKNAIIEIRAGAGGNESALFAADLLRMYLKLAERQGWQAKLISSNQIGLGGYKEAILEIAGANVYGTMKYESGVHRVQRIPETEKRGRVHTSTVTVVVLPEAETVDFKLDPKDLRLDTFCSSGHGGQSVNTTYSAVRVTHLPSNTIVSCQDERSQQQNKEKALTILRSRLLENHRQEERRKIGATRKSQIGSGDRSEKIRTYNFPQDRLTDHRLKENFNNLEKIFNGGIKEVIEQIKERAAE